MVDLIESRRLHSNLYKTICILDLLDLNVSLVDPNGKNT